MHHRVGIAGTGRLACALGRLLADRGVPVAAIAGRDAGRTRAAARFAGPECAAACIEDLPALASRLLIAVTDDAIAKLAGLLAPGCGGKHAVLHTSGRYSAEILAPLAERGASCGSLHPLQTIATPEQGVRALPGSAFAVDGRGEARDWALEIAGLLSGTVLEIPPGRRPLYHAAAVMASNNLIGLLDAAGTLMEVAGAPPGTGLRALAPLARASLENALALGPAQALTGPVERGDAATVRAHIEALRSAPREARNLYRAAALQVLEVARRRSPDRDYSDIENLLENEDG